MKFDNQGDAISREAPDERVSLFDLGTGVERQYTYGDLRRLTGAIADYVSVRLRAQAAKSATPAR